MKTLRNWALLLGGPTLCAVAGVLLNSNASIAAVFWFLGLALWITGGHLCGWLYKAGSVAWWRRNLFGMKVVSMVRPDPAWAPPRDQDRDRIDRWVKAARKRHWECNCTERWPCFFCLGMTPVNESDRRAFRLTAD